MTEERVLDKLFRHAPELKVARGICPECGKRDLHFGPQGGSSTNFACFACHARFNAAFVDGLQAAWIVFLERTGTITAADKPLFRTATIENDVEYVR